MKKCNKHDETMTRIFEKQNQSELKLESIDTKMDAMIEFKDKLHKIIFGDGREGIVSKINRVGGQVILQWALIILIIVAIIGFALRK